jgi:ankyrin repeat protein
MSRYRILPILLLFTFIFFLPMLEDSRAASVDDLIQAIWGHNTTWATYLIDGGVDVNTNDGKGTYPLILACSYEDNDEMIELLLSKGADPNVQGPKGETPLGLAAKYSLKAVQMLVDKGAEVNASDDRGFTALHWAREKGQEEVVKFLLEKGAKE